MQTVITDASKDPLGQMLKDYMNGNPLARVQVLSSMVDMPPMKGSIMFRQFKEMSRIEQRALGLCRGNILDVGAGSGCHTLTLQEKKHRITALDISPGCMDVMARRGVKNRIHDSFFNLKGLTFDTILMLMNGIGICGNLEGLNRFFLHARTLLARGGRIIADSTDLSVFAHETQCSQVQGEPYFGQVDFKMRYKGSQGDPFYWLYVDYHTLAHAACCHGLSCEQVAVDDKGAFLAVMADLNG